MNAKRILALLSAAVLLLCASSCKVSVEIGGGEKNNTEDVAEEDNADADDPEETSIKNAADDTTEKSQTDAEKTEANNNDPNAPTNWQNGEGFPADYTTPGKVEENAPGITENAVIFNGKKYTLPVPMQTFLNDGFYMKGVSEDSNSIKPGYTAPIGLYLYYKTANGEEIKAFHPVYLQNTTETNQKIENCTVTSIEWYTADNVKVAFPGGIGNASTAADVLRIFGTPGPDQNPLFQTGFVGKVFFQYVKNKETGSGDIVFHFNSDGTLKSCKLDPDRN